MESASHISSFQNLSRTLSPQRKGCSDYRQMKKIKNLLVNDKTLEVGRNNLRENLRKLKEFTLKQGVKQLNLKNPTKLKEILHYRLGKILGRGAYAVVRLGHNKLKDGKNVAIKIYDRFDKDMKAKMYKINNEIINLYQINHPNIVKLYDCYEGERYICLIMEYAGVISLDGYILMQRNKRLFEEEARIIFTKLADAVCYLHKKNIVHKDIKLDNILIDIDKKELKLIDFGFSIRLKTKRIKDYCGTPVYIAPEILKNKPFRPKPTDVWALGICLFKMVAGYFPFYPKEMQNDSIDKGRQLYSAINSCCVEYPQYFSPELTEFLKTIFLKDPLKRPTVEKILNSNWILK